MTQRALVQLQTATLEQANEAVLAAHHSLWSSSVAFSSVHLLNPGAGVRAGALVLLAGLCLALLRAHFDSLPAAWAGHVAWNWTMAALLHVPVSGLPFATPGYRVVLQGPDWLTGGTWGPEGSLAAALVMIGVLVWYHRASRGQAIL